MAIQQPNLSYPRENKKALHITLCRAFLMFHVEHYAQKRTYLPKHLASFFTSYYASFNAMFHVEHTYSYVFYTFVLVKKRYHES